MYIYTYIVYVIGVGASKKIVFPDKFRLQPFSREIFK